ncbi:pyruvate kinase [Cellulosilyticum lentocellum]|uniref:Pyruvate kinase n=1 Tax=Cellulosilyticum lentocellum (strain ATCC 49066 / DSM 5427 / NCIMB 11756 / RHM5) TaxID=642492 RepID=F2JRE4_CELLD|nr:pyruvate kinase [Cellulosilyticum lentocellum]ADZ82753.1 pyruvate kinase [Cellulosilyticum lentocellum DSM 5427]
MRKTKIVCTLGPSTKDDKILKRLMLEGMDVARFNFSHGTHESHKENFDRVDKLRKELDLPIAVLLDTKGPEVRVCQFAEGKVSLKKGEQFTLTSRDILGTNEIVSITYKNLPNDVKEGSRILLDDGLIELIVEKVVDGSDIVCKIMNNGDVSNNKGVNLPDTRLSMPYLSEKDRSDIIFGIQTGYDFIAASFVRCAEDVLQIRRILEEYNCHTINIISKIENQEGVDNIDEIIRVSDGIMVARGDMGVEIPGEEVPSIQKMIIKKTVAAGKQVITATQMLDSMMKNPRATRAEISDVANAIYDGTSAIMLSGETAAGAYPVESVQTMARIALKTESDIDYVKRFKERGSTATNNVTSAISHATCTTAHDLGAAAIVTVTKSGRTARMISKYRPVSPILGCTTSASVYRHMSLMWGVKPLLMEEKQNADELFEEALTVAEHTGMVNKGELVVITSGLPVGVTGTTNMIKVDVIGHILVSGVGVGSKQVCGNLCVCKTEEEANEKFIEGDILVIPETTNEMLPLLRRAAGIITEEDGVNSHAAIVGLAIDIPVITGATNATDILKTGSVVSLDAGRGIVSSN